MFKIAWNDGHTLTGVGTGAAKFIKETDRNRRIGAKARNILQNEYKDVKIINCTIDKSSNDMYDAVKKANDNNADLFVSNHVNAGGGVGFEGFHSRYAKPSDINKGKIIYNELAKTKSCLLARRYCSDYSYKKYDLYVLKNTKMPAFLFEIGFVDNKKCIAAINDDEVARAYAEGIAKAYGLKKKNQSNSTTQSTSNTILKVGDRVKITGSKYATGQNISDWAKKQVHTISKIDKDRALLKEITSWCYLKDLQMSTSSKLLTVGMYVQMVGSKWATGQTVPSWVKNNKYKVKQISGDRALLDGVISWAYIKDLKY